MIRKKIGQILFNFDDHDKKNIYIFIRQSENFFLKKKKKEKEHKEFVGL